MDDGHYIQEGELQLQFMKEEEKHYNKLELTKYQLTKYQILQGDYDMNGA